MVGQGLIVFLLAVILADGVLRAARPSERTAESTQLVREALHREVYGLDQERRELLDQALAADPQSAPARWHAGQVRFQDQWLPARDVPAKTGENRRWQSYLQQREEQPDTVAGQLALAAWCAENGLAEQRRAHLARVLELDPDQAAARAQLGHRRVGGVWVTREELQAQVHEQETARKSLERWQERLERISDDLGHRSQLRRDKAAAQLLEITDPSAMAALEQIVAPSSEAAAGLVVRVLGQMQTAESDLALARLAVLSPWHDVRGNAALQLRGRPMENYVPGLLGAMSTPIQSQAELAEGPGGRLVYRHAFVREGQAASESMLFETALRRAARPGGDRQDTLERALTAVGEAAQQAEFSRAQQNQVIGQLNERIDLALRLATEAEVAGGPEEWWSWWNEHNEVFFAGSKPWRQEVRRQEIAVADRTTSLTGAGADSASGSGAVGLDCLAAGTPVWTATGSRAIETIRVGDLVLAQHPDSGELAYKPVLRTTVRPAGRLVQIGAGQEMIQTSGGHLFWVSGEGWVRARQLQSGSELHGVDGTVRVSQVDEGPVAASYNLIVADFHSYFAGHYQPVLCHDNTVRRPTRSLVPGLTEP